jgi:hypothetical protein
MMKLLFIINSFIDDVLFWIAVFEYIYKHKQELEVFPRVFFKYASTEEKHVTLFHGLLWLPW